MKSKGGDATGKMAAVAEEAADATLAGVVLCPMGEGLVQRWLVWFGQWWCRSPLERRAPRQGRSRWREQQAQW